MRLRTVHARGLGVPAANAGALIDLLGGPDDRLWPNDAWPASTLQLEQPLRVGSRGGHGAIRYHVAAYAPGRRVVFAFEPDSGLTGTHETRVDRLGPERCRLVQTTECRLAAKLLPIYPVLRRQHDALLRDVLDRAERELTGVVTTPARWSRTVRIANLVEEALARRAGKLRSTAPSRVRLQGARGRGSPCPRQSAKDPEGRAPGPRAATPRGSALGAARGGRGDEFLGSSGVFRNHDPEERNPR